jgi:hypothetical protein
LAFHEELDYKHIHILRKKYSCVNKYILFCIIIFIVIVCVCSCKGSKHSKDQKVSYTPLELSLRVDVSIEKFKPDSLIDLNLEWKPGSSFKNPEKKLKVYIHFSDVSGKILFQDDHYPPKSTSDWKQNTVNHYIRTIYCPELTYTGDVLLLIGLYDPDDCLKRFSVSKEQETTSEKINDDIIRKKLFLLPAEKGKSEYSSSRVIFKDGWNTPENVNKDNWRWSKGQAILALKNLDSDSVFFMNGWSDPRFLNGEQKITLKMGDWTSFVTSDSDGYIVNKFLIPRSAFCKDNFCDLQINIEQFFIPAEVGDSEDYRTLGFMIKQIYFGPAN